MPISTVSVGQKITASLLNSIINLVNSANQSQRNVLLNSDFNVAQRGTTFSSGTRYTADRWYANALSGGSLVVGSASSPATSFGTITAAQFTTSSSSNSLTLTQALPSDEVAKLRGKTVTFSAKMYASASVTVTMRVGSNTNADTQTGGTWTDIVSTAQSVTTTSGGSSSPSFLTTVAVPSNVNGLRVQFIISNIASATTVTIGQAQLEINSTASNWSLQNGSFASEYSACQRFYYRATVASGQSFGVGQCTGTSTAVISIKFPSTLRSAPSALEQSATPGNFVVSTSSGTGSPLSTLVFSALTNAEIGYIVATTVTANLVGGNASIMSTNATGTYVGFSAEL